MKKAAYVIAVIVLLFAINNLVRSTFDLWQKRDVVKNAEKRLEKEKAENRKLKAEITRVQSKEFIEEEARNKLFLGKPGDQTVIIPQKLLDKKPKTTPTPIPNWQKWLNLFK